MNGEPFHGVVVPGSGEARQFVALEWFRAAVCRATGFDPYPGTLNLRLMNDDAVRRWRMTRELRGLRLTPAAPEACGGRLVRCVVEDRLEAAVVIPDVTRYGDDVLELVAAVHLRACLGLTDGDQVAVTCG